MANDQKGEEVIGKQIVALKEEQDDRPSWDEYGEACI